ncbi:DUF1819 family protein [Dermacoccus nishinomiyaensis]|uniref:DUF1819 family protein n=1 Tax=Dermacoccus nishinomiyaensis TaxID=1274 RepID=UPI0021A519DE|nr:DUF1819 family protein [Dermacoccus nishinomiyaensis]MCT1605414.1 DUF1819 family protein [Dermacoccus nishinomiyaensis]
MSITSQGHDRYALSFTSGALLAREAVIAAPLFLDVRDWGLVRDQLRSENMFQARTASSGFRLAREVAQRLAVLTDPELELLRDASPSERGHLMWVAACRRYAFIGDFAEEVVRERFLLLTPTLGYDDFDSFVRGKALWHPELAEVKDSTLQKLRSTVFRMLTEAGLLAGGEIVNAALSERVRDALDAQLLSDLRYLPARDSKEVSL